jgi:hypothetical protein
MEKTKITVVRLFNPNLYPKSFNPNSFVKNAYQTEL